MAKRKSILIQHLERVSGRVMEEYPLLIGELIRGRSGVYALYRREKLYYVGLASNLMGRIKTHLKDRHHGSWDRFSVYLTARSEHIKELESLLLRIVDPEGNRMTGRLVGSENLSRTLNHRMKQVDADRRASILGGGVAQRRRRSKVASAKKGEPLVGLVDRRLVIKGWNKGWEFTASLRKDGQTRYGNNLYSSPSAAAKVALGRAVNGWAFWHYKDRKSGEWVPLRRLRR